ncbi:MAG: class I SAM-dependent methyltransferase family protein, partial [Methanobacteriota archaeon]
MKSLCIIVPKSEGESVRKKLLDMDNLRKDLIVGKDENNLFFPFLYGIDWGYDVREMDFQEAGVAVRSYIDVIDIPEELKPLLPTSFDIVGEIAVIKIPEDLKDHSSAIGDAILEANKPVRTVVSDEGVTGEHRLRTIKVIAGEDNTITVHKEYGLSFTVDLSKAYFSPRLATERRRIAQQVQEGETIIDMFCGVGPFSIMIAKTVSHVSVFGIDSNQYAIKYFMDNIRLNHVENVVPMQGDVRDMLGSLEPADRIIMDLPHSSFKFFEGALKAVKENGIIHYYEILTEVGAKERENELSTIAQNQGRRIEIEEQRVV